MGSESGPPTKRLRASLNGNIPMTECIREFKLPRQYPSMVPKLQNDTSIEKIKRQSGVASVPQVTTTPKTIQNNDVSAINKVRTIKLKGKDGRDLGEVKLQAPPQCIQGKTITIAKNGAKKPSEAVPVGDKKKGIAVGSLTPVSIVKPLDGLKIAPDKGSIDVPKEKNVTKSLVVARDLKKISTQVDSQGRPQVLVFQSGKSWHMVKIPKTAITESKNHGAKNRVIGKSEKSPDFARVVLPEVRSSKDQQIPSIGSRDNKNNASDKPNILRRKMDGATHHSRLVVKKFSRPGALDSAIDRCKAKSPVGIQTADATRPKIEISRIIVPSGTKKATIPRDSRTDADPATDISTQKNVRPGQNVAIVLPTDEEASREKTRDDSDNEAEHSDKTDSAKTTSSAGSPRKFTTAGQGTAANSNSTPWRRKLLASKYSDAAKNSSNGDANTVARAEKKEDMKNNLIILEKALSTVGDEVLRKKALKALAECGIGIERLVPIDPASESRPVKDSDTQTSIFGLWDSERFIRVAEDLPNVQRISIAERARTESPAKLTTNQIYQECNASGIEKSKQDRKCTELTNMIQGYVKDNKIANQVAAIFDKPCPMPCDVLEKLQKDFADCKIYNEMGLLSIHKAVIADQINAVRRHLMVLRACGENVDLPTQDGQTSLELAVRHGASLKIVRMLLRAGAEPTSTDLGHNSALLIASSRSDPIFTELVPYATTSKSLDNYDSEGFAALHYCAQNGYSEAVMSLIRASANMNLRDRRSGRTPLFHAIENDHIDAAEILLHNGAEISTPNYAGQTIFNVIDEVKHYHLLDVLNRVNKQNNLSTK